MIETEEGFKYVLGLTYLGRLRMAANLLPLLQRAQGLRRVVSSFTGAHDGKFYEEDWQSKDGKIPFSGLRGHAATMMTLGLAALEKKAPNVSFIHNFPGSVKTNIIRGDEGFMMQVAKYVFKGLQTFTAVPLREVGERHTFYCTSAKYPPREVDGSHNSAGAPLLAGVAAAKGINGKMGSGVYTIDAQGESANIKVLEMLVKYQEDGTADRLWERTEFEFKRVTGRVSL